MPLWHISLKNMVPGRASTSSSWIITTHLASNHVSIWIFIFLKAFFFVALDPTKNFCFGVAECVFSTSESLKGNINSYNRNEKGDIICKTAQQKLQQYGWHIFLLCDCHFVMLCENNHCVWWKGKHLNELKCHPEF